MEKVYIVDGHSVIFSTPSLRDIHGAGAQGRVARNELIRCLTEYQDMNDVSVILVFDGKGQERGPQPRQKHDIMVIYSRSGQSADAVVERLVAQYAEKYDINVVSNDRAVLDWAASYGAHPMSVRSMWEIV